jgi:hypothetical protein
MENVGIFYGHLEYLIEIRDILWPFAAFCVDLVHFSGFWYRAPGIIWQPCVCVLLSGTLGVDRSKKAEDDKRTSFASKISTFCPVMSCQPASRFQWPWSDLPSELIRTDASKNAIHQNGWSLSKDGALHFWNTYVDYVIHRYLKIGANRAVVRLKPTSDQGFIPKTPVCEYFGRPWNKILESGM